MDYKKQYELTASIVTYKTKEKDLLKIIKCFLDTKLDIKLYISDNSPTDDIGNVLSKIKDKRIEYVFNNKNGGYGFGHNIILNKILDKSIYHLILNPDIYFESGVLEELFKYMEKNKDIGQIMPLVKYPNGEIQYLCKNYPTPKYLFLRRFCPIKKIVKKNDYKYEMRKMGYNKITDVPILSGCFMFLRTSSLKKVGIFDEKYFMYMEDFDLCRRIGESYRTVFYPNVEIIHEHARESKTNRKLLFEHIKSTVYYFNKWGWIFDKKEFKSIK